MGFVFKSVVLETTMQYMEKLEEGRSNPIYNSCSWLGECEGFEDGWI